MNLVFEKLLEPCKIGKIQTRNRMVKTGNGTGYTGEGGYVSEKHKAYYEAFARGGVGLIIIECPAISDPGRFLLQPHFHDDKFIPGFKTLTQTIHKYGCPTFLQVFAGGGPPPAHQVDLRKHPEMSALPPTESDMDRQFVRRATIAEIQEFANKFATVAERAQKAGFDGIEVNAGTTHLINSFLSRAWNNRQDTYGCQNLENRLSLLSKSYRESEAPGKRFSGEHCYQCMAVWHRQAQLLMKVRFAKILQMPVLMPFRRELMAFVKISVDFPRTYIYPERPNLGTKLVDLQRAGPCCPGCGNKEGGIRACFVAGRLEP
jgi:hypothetical protein